MNLVEITIKANDDTASGFSAIKAKSAKAGDEAARAFDEAFKLRADASATAHDRLKDSGSLGGEDKELMNKLKSFANTPGGIGILGTGNDTSLISALKRQIQSAGESGGLGLLGGEGSGGESTTDLIRQQLTGNGPSNVDTTDMIKRVLEGANPGDVDTTDVIRRVLEGAQPGDVDTTDMIKRVLEGAKPGDVDTTDMIRQVLTGSRPGNIDTDDMIKQVLTGAKPGNVDTTDMIKQVLEGTGPHDTSTTDTIHEKLDTGDVKAQGDKDGKDYGTSFAATVKNVLSGLFGGKGGKGGGIGELLTGGEGGDEGAISGALNAGGIAGGALPGLGGISGMQATITGLIGTLAGLLPAITAVGSSIGVLGGAFMLLDKTNKSFAANISSTWSGIEKVLESAVAPLTKPFEQAFSQLGGFVKSLAPELKSLFSDAIPLIQPLLKGVEALVSGALPGFVDLIKAAGPVMKDFGGSLGNLGKALGEMFGEFAQAAKPSGELLSDVLDIVNSLLPVIGFLAKTFATALAPAFTQFSQAIAAAAPALDAIGKIVGEFAGAVIGDLASVLGAFGTLLGDLTPAFNTLAKAMGTVFNTLENTGVFAILGDALENLAGPLAGLIDALVKGIAPALPGIIDLIGQFSGVVITLITNGLGILVGALTDVVKFLTPIIPLLGYAYVAVRAWAGAQALLNIALDANPIGLIVIAVGALIVAIDEGVKHSQGFRDLMLDVAKVGVEAFKDLADGVLYELGLIIDGAAKAFGWVPGLGPKLQAAATNFDGFRNKVNDAFNGMLGQLGKWRDQVESPLKIPAPKAPTAAELAKLTPEQAMKVIVKYQEDVASYDAAVANVKGATISMLVKPVMPSAAELAKMTPGQRAQVEVTYKTDEESYNAAKAKITDLSKTRTKLAPPDTGGWLSDVTGVFKDIGNWIDTAWQSVYGAIVSPVVRAFDAIENTVTSGFDSWWSTHGKALEQVWDAVWKDITTIAKAAWGLIVPEVKDGWDDIAAIFSTAWDAIAAAFKIGWDALVTVVKIVWDAIAAVLKIAWDTVLTAFDVFLDLLTGHWSQALKDIETYGQQVWNAIKSNLDQVWNAIKTDVEQTWNAIVSFLKQLWNNIANLAEQTWNNMLSTLKSIWNDIKGATETAWNVVYDNIIDPIRNAYDWVTGKLGDMRSAMASVWSGIQSDASKGWGALERIMGSPINFVINDVYMGGIRRLWDDVMGALGLSSLDLPAVSPIALASGGHLPGFGGGDIVPALLEPGETVIDKHRSQKYASVFAAMGVPGYSAGGIVSDAGDVAKMILAASTGNEVAFTNALKAFLPGGSGGAAGQWASMIATAPVRMVTNIVKAAWDQITGAASSGGGGGSGTPGPGGGDAAANQALARSLKPAWGSGGMWSDWLNLWNRESSWNQYARNPSSGAYGIPQALPASKMGAAANPPQSNAHAQETWGIGYIDSRYTNPAGAWAHEEAYGWYGAGGPTSAGWAMVGDQGRELIKLPGGATVVPHGATEGMLGGGGADVHITLELGPNFIQQTGLTPQQLADIRHEVNIRGGNVQTAFGRA